METSDHYKTGQIRKAIRVGKFKTVNNEKIFN